MVEALCVKDGGCEFGQFLVHALLRTTLGSPALVSGLPDFRSRDRWDVIPPVLRKHSVTGPCGNRGDTRQR